MQRNATDLRIASTWLDPASLCIGFSWEVWSRAETKAAVKYSDRLKWFWIGAFNCQMSNPAGKDGAWIGWMMKCYYRVAIESQIVFSMDCVLLWNDYGALCCESVKIWIGKRSQDKDFELVGSEEGIKWWRNVRFKTGDHIHPSYNEKLWFNAMDPMPQITRVNLIHVKRWCLWDETYQKVL